MALVPSYQGQLDVLAAAIAAVLNTSVPAHTSVKLAQAPFAPTPTSDPSTFTEATFTGYAAKTVTAWETSFLSGSVAKTVSTTVLNWAPTDSATPNAIAGYWLVGGNGDYLGGEAFAAPINLTGPTTALNLIPAFGVSPPVVSAAVIN